MKKKIEAEVDFIGGADPLTKEEEKLISDFINARKKKGISKSKKKSSIDDDAYQKMEKNWSKNKK